MKDLDLEIGAALAAAGVRALSWECLSTICSPEIDRITYRIESQSSILKARRLESEEAARVLVTIRRELPPAFAPVLFQHGRVLLEEWIPGTTLGSAPSLRHLEEAGALLGELHARAFLGTRPLHDLRPTAEHRSVALQALRQVRAAGLLGHEQASTLEQAMQRLDPGQARHGLVHFDFCGDNLVVDPMGRLRVVDNERVGLDALAFDLARTWYRWDLGAQDWERFCAAYVSVFRLQESAESLAFWRVVAVARATALRLRVAPAQVAIPLARLQALAEEHAS